MSQNPAAALELMRMAIQKMRGASSCAAAGMSFRSTDRKPVHPPEGCREIVAWICVNSPSSAAAVRVPGTSRRALAKSRATLRYASTAPSASSSEIVRRRRSSPIRRDNSRQAGARD